MNLTPFEQLAYDEQYRVRNRISHPQLGASFTPDITETQSDRDILVSIVGLILFVIVLLLV